MENQIKSVATWLGAGSINVFGLPFAGKDTQGRILAEHLGAFLVAGGDILRSHGDQAELESIMARGDLIPSDLYLKIMVAYLSNSQFVGKPLVLSAVGRLKGEETTVMQATADAGHQIKAVVLLRLSEEEVWKRFDAAKELNDRGSREDDSHTALENRLVKFREQTVPVIDHYRELGLLIEVDGSLSREAVNDEIIKNVSAFAANRQ
jgi:adenylate kinase